MKPQLKWFGLVLAGLCVVAVYSLSWAQVNNSGRIGNLVVNRFLLFTGQHQVATPQADDSLGVTVSGVYRMDTTTGRTWTLRDTLADDGSRTLVWELITQGPLPSNLPERINQP